MSDLRGLNGRLGQELCCCPLGRSGSATAGLTEQLPGQPRTGQLFVGSPLSGIAQRGNIALFRDP